MKVNLVTPDNLFDHYKHPATVLFRALELKAVYNLIKDIEFSCPCVDIGCGNGIISSLLFNENFTYGIDNAEAGTLVEAVECGCYEQVLLEDACCMSLEDSTIAFVFSNSVLEHIPDNATALKEIYRILKPGGFFLFTSPSAYFSEFLYMSEILKRWGFKLLAERYVTKRNSLLNHHHIYNYPEYAIRLRKAGFRLIDYTYCVDSKDLMLWDYIALLSFVGRRVVPNINDFLTEKFKTAIFERIAKAKQSKKIGANLVILCKKD